MAAPLLGESELRFLRALLQRKVPFMLVGLSAAALQGAPVVTLDVDLWFEDLTDPRIREALLEIPAGGADDSEGTEDAAQRELREETGYHAGRLERLCGFFVSPGYCTEFIHIFLATDLVEDPLDGDPDEVIALERVPLPEAARLVETGEVKDGKSIVGLLLAAKRTGDMFPSGGADTIVNP